MRHRRTSSPGVARSRFARRSEHDAGGKHLRLFEASCMDESALLGLHCKRARRWP